MLKNLSTLGFLETKVNRFLVRISFYSVYFPQIEKLLDFLSLALLGGQMLFPVNRLHVSLVSCLVVTKFAFVDFRRFLSQMNLSLMGSQLVFCREFRRAVWTLLRFL